MLSKPCSLALSGIIIKSANTLSTLRTSWPVTDACRLAQGRDALISWRPCLRGASWSALPGSRPSHLHEAGRGVNGFGSFCRNKRASPAGAKPGNSENHVDTRSGHIGEKRLTPNAFFFWKSQDRFLRHIVKLLGRNHQCHMIRYLSMRVPLNRGGALGRRMGCVDRIKGAA